MPLMPTQPDAKVRHLGDVAPTKWKHSLGVAPKHGLGAMRKHGKEMSLGPEEGSGLLRSISPGCAVIFRLGLDQRLFAFMPGCQARIDTEKKLAVV